MSYCTGKHIEKSRGKAMKMLIMKKKPVSVVADRFGVNRSTIWRWHQRWLALNQDCQFTNDNRPSRPVGNAFRWHNAHMERFNRTLQEECTGNYYLESEPLKKMDDKILSYIDFYNYNRIHLGISYRTPAEMLHRL